LEDVSGCARNGHISERKNQIGGGYAHWAVFLAFVTPEAFPEHFGTEYKVPQSQLHSLHQLMGQQVELGTRLCVGPDYRTSVGAGHAPETVGAGILSEVYSRRIQHLFFSRRVNAPGLTAALKLIGYCLARLTYRSAVAGDFNMILSHSPVYRERRKHQ
jgi:hypothetical protein